MVTIMAGNNIPRDNGYVSPVTNFAGSAPSVDVCALLSAAF